MTLTIAEYAAATRIQAIPHVTERAKQVIFDELACACFGRRSPAGNLAARYAAAIGGAAEARILGTRLGVCGPSPVWQTAPPGMAKRSMARMSLAAIRRDYRSCSPWPWPNGSVRPAPSS